MTSLDYTPSADPLLEIARLKLAVRVERERRIMAALWGSTSTECPRAFSLYDNEDGIIATGVVWPDNWTVLRELDGRELAMSAWTFDELVQKRVTDTMGIVRLVWLSEDLDDLTATITDDVERKMRERARTDAVRVAVASAIAAVDPIDNGTWRECVAMADAALAALFEVDES